MLSGKKILAATLPLALAAAQPVFAQTQFAMGLKVSDPSGGAVGTIAQVDGQYVIVKTDKHEVRLPTTSFTAHEGGFILGMTQAELNAAVEKSLAEASAKVVVGATVTGSQGGTVGTIEALDDQFATVKLVSGTRVRLPRGSLGPGPQGALVGMTAAELEAAAAAAAASTGAKAE